MIAPKTRQLGILARWYAEPLTKDEASALLKLSERREQKRLKRNGQSYFSPILKLIALHWLDEPFEIHYHHLKARQERSIHARILKPLIYGQLLLSRQEAGAMAYLDEAFEQMRLLLRPEDYFVVVKRHQLLRRLPLGQSHSPALPLERLLTTAAVIERMQGVERQRAGFKHDPDDTYG